jgi:hypothetical protein
VGYLDEVLPAADLLPRAMQEAQKLGALSRQAYAATKLRLRGKVIAEVEATMDEDLDSLLGQFR